MFMGRGIKGNRVIGATDEKQFLKPINPKSLAIDEKSGIRTRPEHIHQALRELAGIEDHPFSKNTPKGNQHENLITFWVMNTLSGTDRWHER